MNMSESIRIALRSLGANRMRSGLTMLGIVIGVMSVIAMLSIGQGAQAAITSQITSIGTNLLYIRPGSTSSGGVRAAEGSAATLTLEDGEALRDLANIVAVAPQVDSFGQVAYLGNNVNGRVIGTTPDYLDAINVSLAEGEFISAANVTAQSAVVVLGSQIATDLFDTSSPVGQSVRINGQTFRVIGVMTSKGGTGALNSDTQLYVPITTAMSRLSRTGQFRGSNSVSVLNVKITDSKLQDSVIQDIGDVLRERHRTQFQDDFNIQSQQDILNTANQVTGILTLFLGGVAAISLVVGGIGIMNIMLVSVTERTREIGLRKAVGARKRDILAQFLTEATFLSLSGGLIGIVLGAIIAQLISGLSVGGTTVNAVVGMDSVFLAVIFSAGVGLFFGSYPANRAAGLRPIEALRYE
ncbi:MAG: ABC transporter permease [Chloroflexi bacterium]|nr:ABC transporter permease [Chloroflexota bacterium]